MKKLSGREIAQTIRREILEGTFPTGTVMPSENELSERFNVSRSLINTAMKLLVTEGLVRSQAGHGTTVTWLPARLHNADRFSTQARERDGAKGAFDAEVRALGLEPRHEISVEHITPPSEIAELLGLPAGENNVLKRHRRLSASGIPVSLTTSYFPLRIVQGSVLEEPAPNIVGGVKSALADLGHRQTTAEEELSVRLPEEDEAYALEISPERTVTEIRHVGRTADGNAVEVTVTVAPSHLIRAQYTIPLT